MPRSTSIALLVDDDEVVARGLAKVLERLDYTVLVAHDVDTALALSATRTIDIGILDLELGGGTNSSPIALALAAREVPLLLLTGQLDPKLPEVPATAPIAFLTKPATLAAIRTTIDLLRKHAHALREVAKVQFLLNESQRLASIGSFRLDYGTGEIMWTDETYRIYGIERGSFVPTADSFLTLVHPDDRDFVQMMMSRAAGTLGMDAIEYRIVQPGGAIRKVRGMVDHDVHKADATEIIGTIQDITDVERATSERMANEQRVQIANAANNAKTEFLAHMSHELRTPLNAVLGLSEALLERVFGELNAAQVQTLETVHRSGRHLLELINDVLDIARVESGKLALQVEQVALRPLIEESIGLVEATFAGRRQRLVLELSTGLPPVDLDKRRMRQTLINLLGNASKFSPVGGSVLVRVDTDSSRREVAISVVDRGIGIAAEDRARIFEPFVALESM